MARKTQQSPEQNDGEARVLGVIAWLLFIIALLCFLISSHGPLATWVYLNVFASSAPTG